MCDSQFKHEHDARLAQEMGYFSCVSSDCEFDEHTNGRTL